MDHQFMKDDEERGPSRSAKKRAAKEVEELAWQLVELPEATFARLPASAELRAEALLARQVKAHGARKRQTKHLAAALRQREEETEALRAFLDGLHASHYQEQKVFHALEELRERICDPQQGEEALAEVRQSFPGVDAAAITRLARSVQNSGDRKAYREIFRILRSAQEQAPG